MSKQEKIDAVKTASKIHEGNFSFLRGKSFLVTENSDKMKNKKAIMKTSKKKNKYTLNQIGDALFAFIKVANERFNRIEARLDYYGLQIEEINKRLDYYGLQIEQINKRLDYNGLQIEQINKRLDYNNLKKLPETSK